jgi:hypothetical protein
VRVLVMAVLVAAAVLAGPSIALGKGASGATIAGPGGPFDVRGGPGAGEPGSGEPLGLLADQAGFFPAVYGQPGAMLDEAPPGDLGPGCAIDWVLDGEVVTQDLYPYAENGPVTYLGPGQRLFGGQQTAGGWFQGGAALTSTLIDLGLPADPPAQGGWAAPSAWAVPAAVVLLLLIAGGAALVRGRRRQAVLAG